MKKMLFGICIVLMLVVLSVGAIQSETKITSINPPCEKLDLAFIRGRIDFLYYDDYEIDFNAVNVRITSLIPFGFYHLDSDEELSIICLTKGVFPFFGRFTSSFIFGFGEIRLL